MGGGGVSHVFTLLLKLQHIIMQSLKGFLLSTDVSTVNTGLGRPMFWKPLCLLSVPEGLATTNN